MTKVNWIPVNERLPEKSEDHVLVYCQIPYESGKYPYIGYVSYSAKHKAFNATDSCEQVPPYAFKDVTHWAEPIEPPQEEEDESIGVTADA